MNPSHEALIRLFEREVKLVTNRLEADYQEKRNKLVEREIGLERRIVDFERDSRTKSKELTKREETCAQNEQKLEGVRQTLLERATDLKERTLLHQAWYREKQTEIATKEKEANDRLQHVVDREQAVTQKEADLSRREKELLENAKELRATANELEVAEAHWKKEKQAIVEDISEAKDDLHETQQQLKLEQKHVADAQKEWQKLERQIVDEQNGRKQREDALSHREKLVEARFQSAYAKEMALKNKREQLEQLKLDIKRGIKTVEEARTLVDA